MLILNTMSLLTTYSMFYVSTIVLLLKTHYLCCSTLIESESEVAQSCLTLCDPVDCNLLGFSVHGILQARILEWIAISFSRGSSWPKDQTPVSRIGGRCFNLWATREGFLISPCYSWELCIQMDIAFIISLPLASHLHFSSFILWNTDGDLTRVGKYILPCKLSHYTQGQIRQLN